MKNHTTSPEKYAYSSLHYKGLVSTACLQWKVRLLLICLSFSPYVRIQITFWSICSRLRNMRGTLLLSSEL